MIKYKYKYTNTNTQIHKYKYKYEYKCKSKPKSNFDLWLKKKVLTKTAISLEPFDRHRFNTPQIEALGLRDLKNTSGGL